MTIAEWTALLAAVLAAVSVLPGTLGVLMLTNKIAVSEAGARYIYGNALWIAIVSALLAVTSIYLAIVGDRLGSWPFLLSGLVYGGIMVFGFFMHTKFMFRPVREPKYLGVNEAVERFGGDEEVVGVIDPAGRPYAYVARLARRPHIVYQPDGEKPFVMTHCILAHSSMAYETDEGFKQPDITITAALANNMVFYDKASQCSVIQLHNRSLDGSLPLKTIPTLMMKLETWARYYPDSQVWYRDPKWRDLFYLKLLARADVIDPESPVMVYPLQNPVDDRMSLKEQVLGVQVDQQNRTYPCTHVARQRIIEDELGGVPLVIVSGVDGDFMQIFDRTVDGRTLSFEPAAGKDEFEDRETGSQWSLTGRCLSGELIGKSLAPVPHYNKIFWYVWSDFHPGTPIHGEDTHAHEAA